MKTANSLLKEELAKRLEKNPNYSLRSYAKFLDIHVGALSAIMSGTRPLTQRTAQKICEKLRVPPKEKNEILSSTQQDKRFSRYDKSKEKLKQLLNSRIELDEAIFRVISDWCHYAILQLIRTEEYLSSPKNPKESWIAAKLNISTGQVKLALDRLQKLELITKDSAGFYRRTKERLTTANKSVTSPALIKLQKEIRERAIYSLDNHPIEKRSMTSTTMAIDPSKLPEAKKIIDEFELKLSEFLEQGKKLEVYQLEISLFPIKGELK